MLAVIAQMRLQSVQGGSIARLSDRISVSLRTRLIKIDQHFFFFPSFHPTSPPSLVRIRHSSRQLLHFLIPPLVSLSPSLSIPLSADLWEGWVDHLLFGESSERGDWRAAQEGVRHGWKKGMMCVKWNCNYDGSKLRVEVRRCDMLPLKGPGMNHSKGSMWNRKNTIMVYFYNIIMQCNN